METAGSPGKGPGHLDRLNDRESHGNEYQFLHGLHRIRQKPGNHMHANQRINLPKSIWLKSRMNINPEFKLFEDQEVIRSIC